MLDQQKVRLDERRVHPDDGDDFLRGLVWTFRAAPYWYAALADQLDS